MTKIKNKNDKFDELLSKERPIFETLLVRERNNSIKLFSKFKKTKNIINKNKK